MKNERANPASRRDSGPRVGAIYGNIPPARHVEAGNGGAVVPGIHEGGEPVPAIRHNWQSQSRSGYTSQGTGNLRAERHMIQRSPNGKGDGTHKDQGAASAHGQAATPAVDDVGDTFTSGSHMQNNIMQQSVLTEDMNENLLVGRNPIREALRAGRSVEKLLVAKGDLSGAARDIIRMAREAGVVVQTVERSRLDEIYPAHQGMLAYVAAVPYVSVDELFAIAASREEDPFFILLDGVTDPHNLGAILRTAECAGAHGAILPERRSAGLGPAAAKAAAGALDSLAVARVKNLNHTIDELKARGVWVIGTALQGEDALSADLSGSVALVIGSEGNGVSRLTLEKCDRTLTLPMYGHIGSLNASVAAGILMYEVLRTRRQ